MRKISHVTKTIAEDHLTAVVCNRCGREFAVEDEAAMNTVHDFAVFFRYPSAFDMGCWTMDLCESCLFDFVSTFRHAPDGFAESARRPDGELSFDEWAAQHENWRDNGGQSTQDKALANSFGMNEKEDE